MFDGKNLQNDLVTVECILSPHGLGCCPFLGIGSAVVDLLLFVTQIVGFCIFSMFCCALLYVHL